MLHITGYEHLQQLKNDNVIGEELQVYLQDVIWQRYDLENNEDWYDVEELTEKRKNGTLEVDNEWFKIVVFDEYDDLLKIPSFDGFCDDSILNAIPEQVEIIVMDNKPYYHEILANTDDIVDFIIPEKTCPDVMKEKLFRMKV